MSYDKNMQLSPNYKLADFLVTSYAVDNTPTSGVHIQNLRELADTKEFMDKEIGPSKILSGFRSTALQAAIKGDHSGAAAPGTSYHEQGKAIDVYPTTMSPALFFGLLLGHPELRARLGEIALKPSQNSLHLSTASPTKQGVAMLMDANEIYRRITPQEELTYIKPNISIAQLGIFGLMATGIYFIFKYKDQLIGRLRS